MRYVAKAAFAAVCALTLPALALLGGGCGRAGVGPGGGSAALGGSGFSVVAAENFWGSIASQLGGARTHVSSIIVNPSTDPHSYEPNASDARTIAGARLVIVNGIGYDNWARRLLDASPSAARAVLDVGKVLSLGEGDNPHQWYSPAHVALVAERIAAEYKRIDPPDAAYYAARQRDFIQRALARYDALRREIRTRYAGVPVGYSESIFQPLGEDLRLRLLTPYGFAKAVAEGTDVTARDKQTVDAQASNRRIAVWVYNSQNVSPDVQRVNEIAHERAISVATVTETLSPQSDSFEQWQVAELERLMRALHAATGH